ncbi:MAG: hypothetical protein PCALPYG88_4253 [uncultured Paraburkholderia sp.]|uniref:ATP-binding protein n=1 Tax=uncultured Paraburkholderia sp. TaxID=1822466 RepID=UPI002591A86F|nr:ATP-binding protein [uncultured Paraburkholderia sp.]CAH2900320.1 MAG: hypothetical protein PCALPYG08_4656 [uncultured Paraburkholderia sp.]CAH2928636.1 MAG: hypothetical protein PCALPYG88_4253 [uncultured Paraburkholderia sp.]
MTRNEALRALSSEVFHDRLRAARFLATEADITAIPRLQEALKKERVGYVRSALQLAISRCARLAEAGGDAVPQPETEPTLGQMQRQVLTKATERITGILLHDLEPKIGFLRNAIVAELPAFQGSATKKWLESLERTFRGIQQLRVAASAARMEEFDLAQLVSDIVAEEGDGDDERTFLQGERPFVVVSDPGLLSLAISNGLRNAYESVNKKSESERGNVIVDWGHTDVETYLTITDQGEGLAGPGDAAFEIGATNKKGHIGYGLAITRQALESLDGRATLEPVEPTGALLDLRWSREI